MTTHNCPICANSTTDDEPNGWCSRCIGELISLMGWDEHFLDAAEWEWTGALNTNGYGQFHDGSRAMGAHRFSWCPKCNRREPVHQVYPRVVHEESK